MICLYLSTFLIILNKARVSLIIGDRIDLNEASMALTVASKNGTDSWESIKQKLDF
ncbi:hypothetical protein D3C83_238570 [compost metagenome]